MGQRATREAVCEAAGQGLVTKMEDENKEVTQKMPSQSSTSWAQERTGKAFQTLGSLVMLRRRDSP